MIGIKPFLPLAVTEHAPEQARLAVLAGRVEPHVVPADRGREQPLCLLVAVDDVVRRERPRVDERVDVGDHGVNQCSRKVVLDRYPSSPSSDAYPPASHVVGYCDETSDRSTLRPGERDDEPGSRRSSLRRRDRCFTAHRGSPRSASRPSCSFQRRQARAMGCRTAHHRSSPTRSTGSTGAMAGTSAARAAAFIVIHWTLLGSRVTDPIDDRLRACDPHRRPEHRHDAHLLGHERGPRDDGDDEAAQGRRDGSVDHRRGDDRPEKPGWSRTPVTLQWSGTDATSGIASCSPQLTYSSPDTTGTSQSGSCVDNAGNTSAAALTVH